MCLLSKINTVYTYRITQKYILGYMHSYEISIILKILFKYMDYIHYMSILTDVFNIHN